MIPAANIVEWGDRVPWPSLQQIEQDLIICRALCDIFGNAFLAERLAFRGGTAINKLLFEAPLRYSEDIDLVQLVAEPLGPTIDALRETLAWLGRCRVDRARHSTHLIFRFRPESAPQETLNLKVEINTREHKSLFEIRRYPFEVSNSWFSARAKIRSYDSNELFGTKFRALLQRDRNRDLFDLGEGIKRLGLDGEKVVASFEHYLNLSGEAISRARAEQRLLEKVERSLTEDVTPLLPAGVVFDEKTALAAFQSIWTLIVPKIKGSGWKRTSDAIDEIRKTIPSFLL